MASGRRGATKDFKPDSDEALSDIIKQSEAEELLRREAEEEIERKEIEMAIAKSKIDFGNNTAADQNFISDDEETKNSSQFQNFVTPSSTIALNEKIFTDQGSPEIFSADSLNEKFFENFSNSPNSVTLTPAQPDPDVTTVAQALKQFYLPPEIVPMDTELSSTRLVVDWEAKIGESKQETTDRIVKEYRRYFRWINEQRRPSHEDTIWIPYKDGEVLGSKRRNVAGGQLSTWYSEYYSNGVPEEAKKWLENRRKRLRGKETLPTTPIFIPTPSKSESKSDKSPSASISSSAVPKFSGFSSSQIESSSQAFFDDDTVPPSPPPLAWRLGISRGSVGNGRGIMNEPENQPSQLPVTGRLRITGTGRASSFLPTPSVIGRGRNLAAQRILHCDDDLDDFLQIQEQITGIGDVSDNPSDEEYEPANQKKNARKGAKPKPSTTAGRGRGNKAPVEKKSTKQAKSKTDGDQKLFQAFMDCDK